MAATYTAIATGVTHSTSNKIYLQIFNQSTSGVTIKIYRIWLLNAQGANATGILLTSPIILAGISTAASVGSPTTITPIKHDTNSATLSNVTINSGNTTNGTLVNSFRRMMFSTDEPATGTFKLDNLYAMPNLALFWDCGYGDTNHEPLTLPSGSNSGIQIYSAGTASAAGNVDVIVEFTAA